MPIRTVAERMHPPRALYVEFPLGLPLGKPGDADFQHRVLGAAFALLGEPAGPVLADFPEAIKSEDTEPLQCSVPPRYDPELHPAVDEAQGLRSAHDRAVARNGRTTVGSHVSRDDIPDAIGKFARIAAGEPWDAVGLDGSAGRVGQEIRTYYEELACELADGPAGPWAVERWFYERTQTGKVLLEARRRMRDAGAPQLAWFLLAPASRE
ncbi:MAG: hypothetical protein OXH15_20265 [Gammaproteobacteria bacterium]|nr:hypothetical protein [Gammaproteobacteria bacterium]